MLKTTYAYGSGQWVEQSTKKFVYDGWNLIAELDEAGDVERYFVWGLDLSQTTQNAGGVGGLICAVDSSNGISSTYHYFYDGNGNVGQVANSADGTIVAFYEYDPFGKTVKTDGVYAAENLFRFSTKFYDEETQLCYYGFRFYFPLLGRWLNPDPITEKGGYNLHSFVLNNPVSFSDYLGLYDQAVEDFMGKYNSSELYYETEVDEMGYEWKIPIPPEHDAIGIYPMLEPYYDDYPELNAYDPTPKCKKGYHYDSDIGKCVYGKPKEKEKDCCYCQSGDWSVIFGGGAGVKGGLIYGAGVNVVYWTAYCYDNEKIKMDGWSSSIVGPFAIGASVGGVVGGGKIEGLRYPQSGISVNLGVAGGGAAGSCVASAGFDASATVNVFGENEVSYSLDANVGTTGVAGAVGFTGTFSYTLNVECDGAS